MTFIRTHHQKIAKILQALDADVLRQHGCLFAGGTAIALLYGEYRESVDMDFLVSSREGYRALRNLLIAEDQITPICKQGQRLQLAKPLRKDQYGIRTAIVVDEVVVKFEVVKEGRIDLLVPEGEHHVCGIDTAQPVDLLASKLLANSDRWQDDSVYSRDVIDMLMMPWQTLMPEAVKKAKAAYGNCIEADLHGAIQALLQRPGWLDECMQSMAIDTPKAVLWKRAKALSTKMGSDPWV